MRRSAPLALLLLASCQSYEPQPLTKGPQVPTYPERDALARDTSAITRPFLHPVTVQIDGPLDGNAIATLAVVANPDLKAERARAGISDAQSFAARLLPDPTLSLGAGSVLSGPDVVADLASALGVDLNALRTRRAQLARADAAAKQVRLDLAWSEWQTAGAARIQAVRVISLGWSAELARRSFDQARSLFDRNQAAASRGDISASQLETARLSFADAQDKHRTAESDRETSRLELARLLGLAPQTRLSLKADEVPDIRLDPDRLFAIATSNRTDLQALEAGYAAQEAAVRKAILDQFPTLNLTINTNRDTGGNLIVGPAIDFTLPLWNRNRGGIAIEKATREALRAEYDARLFRTHAEITAAVTGIDVMRRQRDAIRNRLPKAAQLAAANRRAAGRGDIAKAVVETADQALRDQEILLEQSERAIAEQMIALELLTGTLREVW